jgi:hypothetical protein
LDFAIAQSSWIVSKYSPAKRMAVDQIFQSLAAKQILGKIEIRVKNQERIYERSSAIVSTAIVCAGSDAHA